MGPYGNLFKKRFFQTFLNFCPRAFFIFKINENSRKKSPNGEIKKVVQSNIKVNFLSKKKWHIVVHIGLKNIF